MLSSLVSSRTDLYGDVGDDVMSSSALDVVEDVVVVGVAGARHR